MIHSQAGQRHPSKALRPVALSHYTWFSHCNPVITQQFVIFDAQASDTPSSSHSNNSSLKRRFIINALSM